VTDRARVPASPRTAVLWSVLEGEVERRRTAAGEVELAALDVGGGSGVFAVPLATMGLTVTVVDVSADALATLRRRSVEAGVADRVTAIQGDADRLADLTPPAAYDMVLCHSLLEVVDDAAATTATIAAALRPGGCASILVANRAATVLARALGGHLVEAYRALTDPTGRYNDTDAVRRRLDLPSLTALIESAGLVAEQLHGVGVVADLIAGALLDGLPGGADALRELEMVAAGLPPYRDIASQLHALARHPR
jgi:2-polyprenyl-3-methyl-5-hydroxy-6-metoxy-1,4-benzoquinol methylase